jgi:hypothetical protein
MSENFEHEGYIRISVPADLSLDKGWELEALLRAVEEAMAEAKARPDGSTYQMVVELPADIERVLLDEVFEFIADAAHEFEERWPNRTWDVHVAGGVLSKSHSAEAAFRRVFDENERLQSQLDEARQVNENWVTYKGRVVQREKGWRGALVLALGLEEDAPLPSMEELIGRVTAQRAALEGQAGQ